MIERAQSIPAMESIDPKEYLAKYVNIIKFETFINLQFS